MGHREKEELAGKDLTLADLSGAQIQSDIARNIAKGIIAESRMFDQLLKAIENNPKTTLKYTPRVMYGCDMANIDNKSEITTYYQMNVPTNDFVQELSGSRDMGTFVASKHLQDYGEIGLVNLITVYPHPNKDYFTIRYTITFPEDPEDAPYRKNPKKKTVPKVRRLPSSLAEVMQSEQARYASQ